MFGSAGLGRNLSRSTGLALQDVRVGRIGPMLVKIDGARLPGCSGRLNREETSLDQLGAGFPGFSGRPGWAETSLDRPSSSFKISGSAESGGNISRSVGLALQDFRVG